jgi:hypothetical protein
MKLCKDCKFCIKHNIKAPAESWECYSEFGDKTEIDLLTGELKPPRARMMYALCSSKRTNPISSLNDCGPEGFAWHPAEQV